ncbi:MAG: hypothetical protein NTU80_13145 [Verrucomicrobia bacterium]|nr:hypothetical protein [Verrucomicrobiota bacterium]
MPANPSADGLRRAPRVRVIVEAARFTPAQKLRLLALNAWPLLHAVITLSLAFLPPAGPLVRFAAAAVCLLLLPPLLARLVLLRAPLPAGDIAIPSTAFFNWWTTWQLQMIFNRLAWIEELLRLVPGAYSAWLRLWGAHIGRLTLWSPGVRLYDRPLLRLGDDVVLGLDARIVGHFGGLDSSGRATLTLGSVTLGDRCTLGAGALLAPGLHLEADQATEVLFLGPPFTRWRQGQRLSSTQPTTTDSSTL